MVTNDVHVSFKLTPKAGTLKATCSIAFQTAQGELLTKGWKIVQDGDKPAWLAVPSREYVVNGEKKFEKLIELSQPAHKELSAIIVARYEIEAKKGA